MDEDLMSATEAGLRWGYDEGYVRQMYQKYSEKIPEGEIRKFGKTLVITRFGMEQLTGKKEPEIKYYLIEEKNWSTVDEKEFKSFDAALHELKQKVVLNADLTKEIKIEYLNTSKTKYGFSVTPGDSFYVETKMR